MTMMIPVQREKMILYATTENPVHDPKTKKNYRDILAGSQECVGEKCVPVVYVKQNLKKT